MDAPATPTFETRLKGAAARFAAGDHAGARAAAEALVAENPDSFDAVHLLGTSLAALGQLGLACIVLRQAVSLQPRNAQARHNLARTFELLGRPQEAAAELDLAGAGSAETVAFAMNLAEARMRAGDTDRALAVWRHIAEQRPDEVQAHRRMAEALHAQRRFDEAVEAWRRALRLLPDDRDLHQGLAKSLISSGRADEAVASARAALGPTPTAARWSRLGLALMSDGRPEQALIAFDNALRLQPDYHAARWNRSIGLLSQGNFEEGWRDYELRWNTQVFANIKRLPRPVWLGSEDLAGKSLLITAEQGHGDTMQFIRLVPQVVARGAEVVVEVQAPLQSLIRSMPGIGTVLARGEKLPPTDFQCSMMSLPHALGLRLETIPAEVPYLRASAESVERWRGQLPNEGRPRVGLVWAGTPWHGHDRSRSLPLEVLRPLLQREDVSWVALQKEVRQADWQAAWSLSRLHLLGPRVANFEDTAAIVTGLDLVITVDTSVAHLVGAMGKPVWILLPVGSDYRWMYGTDRSPWYPTARLFRRTRGRDWAELIGRVGTALDAFLQESPRKAI